ncbi:MAG: type II toxin-antitoxin system RelE/ParE family toxin [Sulfuricaulis sp.]|nr:type II toxin-antitoxin system RelE/ParE family toxin [Sulfuricaulis sp.]
MIKSFRHKGLEKFFKIGSKAGIQPQHAGKLQLQLTALEHATSTKDMNAPGWRLHRLSGDFAGFYSIMVSGNWRLIFRFEDKEAADVDYVDYH